MGAFARAFQRSHAAGRVALADYAPPLTEQEVEQNLLTRAVRLPLEAGSELLNALDYIAATTRAGIGQITGAEETATGRETILGTAPSGRELWGLGPGEKGTYEGAPDILGFATEIVADPLMFVPIGALTKGGKAAAEGAKALETIRAGGKLAEARKFLKAADVAEATAKLRELGPELTRFRAAARARGVPEDLLRRSIRDFPQLSLREQAELGGRSLLSLDIPGTRFNMPLARGARTLGALGAAGRGIAAPFRPLTERLRPGGRTGNPLFNATIGATQRQEAAGRFAGIAAARAIDDEIRKLVAVNPEIGEQLAERIGPLMQSSKRAIEDRFAPIIEAAERELAEKGATDEAVGLAKRVSALKRERDLNVARLNFPETTPGLPTLHAMVILAAEKGGVAHSLMKDIDELATKVNKRIAKRIKKSRRIGTVAEIRKANAANLKDRERLARKIFAMKEHGRVAEGIMAAVKQDAPELYTELQKLHAAIGSELAFEIRAGVPVSALDDPLLAYMHRRITKEGREWALRQEKTNPFRQIVEREHVTKGGFAKDRVDQFRGMPVPQINDLAKQLGFQGGEFFSTNASESVLMRFFSGARSRAGAFLHASVLDNFALPKGLAQPGAIPIEEAIAKSQVTRVGAVTRLGVTNKETLKLLKREAKAAVKGTKKKAKQKFSATEIVRKQLEGTRLEGRFVDRDIWHALQRASRAMEDPDDLRGAIRFIDKVNGLYRGLVTQLFPAFHSRNAISNWFMMNLAGMHNPAWIGKAIGVQWRMARGRATDADKAILRDLAEYAAAGHTYAGETARLMHVGDELVTHRIWSEKALKRPLRHALISGASIGNTIEDNAKLAMFMWGRAKGMSKVDAGDLVKRFLFDYSDLSRFEKARLRRLSYFYTWQRKAIPLIVEEMFLKPRNLALYGHAIGEVGSRREGRANLPPWLRDRTPFDFGLNDEGERIFVTTGLPPEDVMRFGSLEGRGVERFGQKLLAQLAPIPRLPLEAITGINLATGRRNPRPGRLAQTFLNQLPPRLRGEFSFLAPLEQSLPTARLTGTFSRIGDLLAGETSLGEAAIREIGGASVRTRKPREDAITEQLRKISLALDRLEDQGLDKSYRARQLRSMRGKLTHKLNLIRR